MKKISGSAAFTCESRYFYENYQSISRRNNVDLIQTLQETLKKEQLSTLLCEAWVILMPEYEKDIVRKEKYVLFSFCNLNFVILNL